MAESWDHLEDWEEWTPESGTSFHVHALAGSLAGTAEHCLIFPIDTIKTHLQTEGVGRGVLKELIAKEGISRLWRGVSTMLTACVPAHAAYFSIFESSKVAFGADQENHTPLAAAAAGALATISHDSIMVPFDVVKQRLQLGLHSGMADCARHVIRSEGFGALFLSFPTTLMMNVPFAGITVAANESFKKILNPSNEYNLPAFFVSGGAAGAVAATLTTPLDVIKTRLQTQSVMIELANRANASGSGTGSKSSRSSAMNKANAIRVSSTGLGQSSFLGGGGSRGVAQPAFGLAAPYYSRASKYKTGPSLGGGVPSKGTSTLLVKGGKRAHSSNAGEIPLRYTGFADTAQRIYQEEGVAGFMRGWRPRLMVFAPSVAISWTTYETAKSFLSMYF